MRDLNGSELSETPREKNKHGTARDAGKQISPQGGSKQELDSVMPPGSGAEESEENTRRSMLRELRDHEETIRKQDLELSQSRGDTEELRRLEQEPRERNRTLETLTSNLGTNEQRFRELAESLADPFFSLDTDLRYTYWNEASEHLTGIPASAALGRSIYEVFPGDTKNRDSAIAVYRRVLNKKRPATFENEFELEDGVHHFQISVYPILEGITVFVKDVTENRRILDDLRLSNEELDTFALVVTHDIGSSLVFIEEFAGRALHACAAGERDIVEREVEQVIEAVQDTRDYIEQLHEYARAGYREEDEHMSCCVDVLQEVIAELAVEVEKAGAEISIQDDLPYLAVDPLKLHQVFRNLVKNALDHACCEGLRIEIGSKTIKGAVRLHVMDNGRGIAHDEKAGVFLPFKRLQAVETRGMGIGLSIAKRAVESWGGRIWVESSPGEGCRFFFTAPSGTIS